MASTPSSHKLLLNAMFWALPISGGLLMAGDPAWMSKPIPSWTEADARQILANSPWSKTVVAGITRRQSEDERRAGGQMGEAHGVGYDGVGTPRPKPQMPIKSVADLVKPTPYVPPPTEYLRLQLRWESALPVRAAELKTGFIPPPILVDDGYSIAVYGIPGEYFKGDPKSLGDPLKKQAALKRDGQKDVRPSSAEVFQGGADGVVVVYVFPLSAEISRKDGHVDFEAQIGRLVFTQTFNLDEMEFQGKPAY
jgi:hypothetical protein